jgi:O-antigen/teichoic acid export membrane protein
LSNKELILSALPFAITLGVIPLIGRFEKLLLSAYHGTAEVAVFHVAFLAYLAGLTLPQAIRAAMLPILGQIRTDISATMTEIRKARRIILWLIPLGLVGGAVVVKLLMQVAFSDYVDDSYGLFLILLAGWAITMLTAPNYVAVQAGANPWRFTLMLFIGVSIAIISALAFIPELGVVGAAYSSVIGALAIGVVAVVFSGEFSNTSPDVTLGSESE